MDILKYKDFEGSAELDLQRGVCRGRILFIDDTVTYESKTIIGLQKQFEAAVLDYIETCRLVDKEPQKSCRGQFNVRVTPELHRAAVRRAAAEDTSLNEVVRMALHAYLQPSIAEAMAPMRASGARGLPTASIAVPSSTTQATQLRSASMTVDLGNARTVESASFYPGAWRATSTAAAIVTDVPELPYAH